MTETGEPLVKLANLYRHLHFVADILPRWSIVEAFGFLSGRFFWRLGQEKRKTNRVILTNHAYLLTRLEDDKSLLQESVLVVDEAQNSSLL